MVNAGVVVAVPTETIPPVQPTEVTVPVAVPAGTLHVPSPRQKVVAPALVPLFKLATGKLPDTSVARATAPHVGVVALPCNTWLAVPEVSMVFWAEVMW